MNSVLRDTIQQTSDTAESTDYLADAEESVVGHIRDDPQARADVERLAERTDVDGLDAVARVLLAIADGEEPARRDVETVLGFGEGDSA